MSRPATARLKVNPPLGKLPVLQYLPPTELKIDASYQRSLDATASKSLIRKIAQFWNWDLCQPLVVSRRDGSEFFVIDGQHRLAAARLRPDIGQLPCVVVEYTSSADEAASFVHLNQQRRPLNALDVFKAAVASDDEEAVAISAALHDAGLSIAPHSNYTVWKPGMVSNIGGIQRAWRSSGQAITRRALEILSEAYQGEVLRYAGTIFPGIVRVITNERQGCDPDEIIAVDREFMPGFVDVVAAYSQAEWARAINKRSGDCSGGRREAAWLEFEEAWAEFLDAYFDEDDAELAA